MKAKKPKFKLIRKTLRWKWKTFKELLKEEHEETINYILRLLIPRYKKLELENDRQEKEINELTAENNQLNGVGKKERKK